MDRWCGFSGGGSYFEFGGRFAVNFYTMILAVEAMIRAKRGGYNMQVFRCVSIR